MALKAKNLIELVISARDSVTGVVGRINTQLGGLKTAANRAGSAISAAFAAIGASATTAGAAILAAFIPGLRSAARFEAALDRVAAKANASTQEVEALRAKAEELGANTKFTATEAAEGFEILAQAGINATDSLAVLPAVLNTAIVASTDLKTAATLVSDALTQFGLAADQAGRVSDVLARGSLLANTTITDLGNALSYAGGVAKSAGLSLEEVTAAIDVLAGAGLRNERAGTGLRNILLKLQDPASAVRQALRDVGIQTDNLATAFTQLSQRGGAQVTRVLNAFDDDARAAAQALVDGASKMSGFTAQLNQAGGSAADLAEQINANLLGALTRLSSAWDAFSRRFGDLLIKPLTAAANGLAALIGFFAEAKNKSSEFAVSAEDVARVAGQLRPELQGVAQDMAELGVNTDLSRQQMDELKQAMDSLQRLRNLDALREQLEAMRASAASVEQQLDAIYAALDAPAEFGVRAEGVDALKRSAVLLEAQLNVTRLKMREIEQEINQTVNPALQTLSAESEKAADAQKNLAAAYGEQVAAQKEAIDGTQTAIELLEREYKVRQAQAQAALDVAKSRKDELAIQQASVELTQLEAEKAHVLAAFKDDLARRAETLTRTLREQAAADKDVTQAEKEAIEIARQDAAAKRASAAIAKANAVALGAEADAYKTLAQQAANALSEAGITSQAELERAAESAKALFESLRDNGGATADQRRAFAAYAEAIRRANEFATSFEKQRLETQLRYQERTIKVGISTEKAAQNFAKAEEKSKRLADASKEISTTQIDQAAESAKKLAESVPSKIETTVALDDTKAQASIAQLQRVAARGITIPVRLKATADASLLRQLEQSNLGLS